MKLINTYIKDPLLSKTLKAVLARLVADFGTVSNLSIDTNSKAVSLTLQLLGESAPFEVNVQSYELSERDGSTYLVVRRFSTSKSWLDIVVRKYAPSLQFVIPNEYASLIKRLG